MYASNQLTVIPEGGFTMPYLQASRTSLWHLMIHGPCGDHDGVSWTCSYLAQQLEWNFAPRFGPLVQCLAVLLQDFQSQQEWKMMLLQYPLKRLQSDLEHCPWAVASAER